MTRRRLAIGAAVAAGVVLIVLLVAVPLSTDTYRIPSGAMSPTLEIGDRILVNRIGDYDPRRGDIVVFRPPAGADANECGVPRRSDPPSLCPRPTPGESRQTFVKRIVGLPGDRISISSGLVVLNGRSQDEGYARFDKNCLECEIPAEITVPPGHVFVLGDNRGASADSRIWGPVREESLIGEVSLRYWPPGDFGKP